MSPSLLWTVTLAFLTVGVSMVALGLGQLRGRAPLRGSCSRDCGLCASHGQGDGCPHRGTDR